jgi:hypothetical protein
MGTETDIEAVIAKVRKLLALAGNNTNEAEAASAAQKAQDLLEAYNLDIAIVNEQTRTFAAREDTRMGGGLYKWQRALWYATATLNFCRYSYIKGNKVGGTYEHQLIGSKANVIGARVMAEYLEGVTERLARRWVRENRPGKSVFIKDAIAYREGLAGRLANRLWTKRWEHLATEKERIKQERERNRAQGVNTENALVLQDVINTEEDLNTDYLNGWEPGTAAKYRLEREARQAAAEAAADEALRKQAEWDRANPEAAAKRKAAEAAKDKEHYDKYMNTQFNSRKRKPTAEELRRNTPAYREGWHKGEEVQIERQVKEQAQAPRIR